MNYVLQLRYIFQPHKGRRKVTAILERCLSRQGDLGWIVCCVFRAAQLSAVSPVPRFPGDRPAVYRHCSAARLGQLMRFSLLLPNTVLFL